MQPWSDAIVYPLFFASVALSAATGGLGPGLLATLLGLLGTVLLLLWSPVASHHTVAAAVERLSMFVPIALLITSLQTRLHRAHARASAALQRLTRSQESLAEAQRIAHLGNWDWNIRTNELCWSDEIYRIFGLTPQQFGATYPAFLACVLPEDRATLEAAVEAAVRRRAPYAIDHRIVWPDGTQRIVHEEGEVTRDAAGTPLRMLGTVQDITERRTAEQALATARQALLQAEVDKKDFTREVLRCVTQGKFHLVDASEIPTPGRPIWRRSLAQREVFTELRGRVRQACCDAGYSEQRVADLDVASAEAAGNAIRHATGGEAAIFASDGRVTVRVSDRGGGIRPQDLPATVLLAGFSTRVSLGMGYTLMLQMSDVVWLATGPGGTVVQLEMGPEPQTPETTALAGILQRFDRAAARLAAQ